MPMKASAFSPFHSFNAACVASAGGPPTSAKTGSIWRPRMPPLALISSTAICAQFCEDGPNSPAGPDSGIRMPTLIGPAAKAEVRVLLRQRAGNGDGER
jgi:hypothetical protein